ncbi:MAG: hypothetical protein J6S14_04180 [Clostridia bacterium]|nr:hypothetical protein [Clostridia bacterium]
MTGINILAEYTAGGMPVEIVLGLLIVAAIGLFLFIIGVATDSENSFAVGVILVLFALAAGIVSECTKEPDHTQYKVTISDDVNLIEFLEKYEILDTEGEIYTIREVTPDA